MKNLKLLTKQERNAYQIGYEKGKQEGLKKASMIIQLVALDSDDFQQVILQNCKEAIDLRKLMTSSEQEVL